MEKLKYAILLITIFLAGCIGSTGDNGAADKSGANKVLTEEEQGGLANLTFNYIKDNFLGPQGISGELEDIEPFGEELYVVNFTFMQGSSETETQAYVTSSGKLILGQMIDITKPPETQAPPQEPAPAEIQRTSVSMDGDPCKGSKDAPVTIIEFSDFQCPFCLRFWRDTLPQLEKEYIDTGKVKLVYRDFPIEQLHPLRAQQAAESAECANDQGKFWEMHDKIFEGQSEWGNTDAVSIFKRYASELELDEAQFDSCLDSGKYTDEVKKDLQDGTLAGVTGTPGFFVNGILLPGAQPFSVFKQIIDNELATGSVDNTITGTCKI